MSRIKTNTEIGEFVYRMIGGILLGSSGDYPEIENFQEYSTHTELIFEFRFNRGLNNTEFELFMNSLADIMDIQCGGSKRWDIEAVTYMSYRLHIKVFLSSFN